VERNEAAAIIDATGDQPKAKARVAELNHANAFDAPNIVVSANGSPIASSMRHV
jgi:hypothetical protein